MSNVRSLAIILIASVIGEGIEIELKEIPKHIHFLSDSAIDYVNNNLSTTWKAGRNFAENTPEYYFQRLMGTLPTPDHLKPPILNETKKLTGSLPKNFDSRKNWPNCPTINVILDQADCGACWAFATTGAFSDRLCIHGSHHHHDHHSNSHSHGHNHRHHLESIGNFSTTKKNLLMSATDILSCCGFSCGFGCGGGYPGSAWRYLKNHGAVTGGGFGDKAWCRSYPFSPCGHVKNRKCGPTQSTPKCHRKCQKNYKKNSYSNDLHKCKSYYTVPSNEKSIMNEIYKNGPVEATMTVFDDFVHYKSGIYQRHSSNSMGLHAIRIIGWGVKNSVKYWLIANSWNTVWGDKGFFKIIRGKNECGIEGYITAGMPE